MKLDELPKEVLSKLSSASSLCLVAMNEGNLGKARAYARIGISSMLLFWGGSEQKYGRNTLENLKYISRNADETTVIDAAERLLGGERNMVLGEKYSLNPFEDFNIILSYLVRTELKIG